MAFRNIVSGEETGAVASLMRLVLSFLSLLYGLAIKIRIHFYDKGWRKAEKLATAVICIGNITAGGTGKTPMVIWLCRYLMGKRRRVVVLTRGYKPGAREENDEMLLLRKALPNVPVVMDSDRVRGGRKALLEYKPEVLVLDDGMQHRRLHRDLDIVLVDATCPFGYDSLLPRGLLREPVSGIGRAQAAVVTRADQVMAETLAALKTEVAGFLQKGAITRGDPVGPVATAKHRPIDLKDSSNRSVDMGELRNQFVFVFCGLGRPQAFVRTIQQLSAQVVREHFYPDHYQYKRQDLIAIVEMAQEGGAEWIVTTEKDWVKIESLVKDDPAGLENLYWLQIEAEVIDGQEALCYQIDQVCQKPEKSTTP